ncbi:MAG TPA: hypothetical protein VGM90_16725 [Kofleriaceae bacterium]|jgi:hypothetical protein
MISQPDFAQAWFRQREAGARAVSIVEARELHALSEEEALAASEALLAAVDLRVASADRLSASGFVEQQRLFARARR